MTDNEETRIITDENGHLICTFTMAADSSSSDLNSRDLMEDGLSTSQSKETRQYGNAEKQTSHDRETLTLFQMRFQL